MRSLWAVVMPLCAGVIWLGGVLQAQELNEKSRSIASGDEAQIKAVLDQWRKAFEAHDIDSIMAIYAPGEAVIAYDVVAPLQYKGLVVERWLLSTPSRGSREN